MGSGSLSWSHTGASWVGPSERGIKSPWPPCSPGGGNFCSAGKGFLEEALSAHWSLAPPPPPQHPGSGCCGGPPAGPFSAPSPACPEPFPFGEAVGVGGLGAANQARPGTRGRGFWRRPAVLCAVAGWTRGAVPGAACGLAHCPVPLSAGQAFPAAAAGGAGRGGLLRDGQAGGARGGSAAGPSPLAHRGAALGVLRPLPSEPPGAAGGRGVAARLPKQGGSRRQGPWRVRYPGVARALSAVPSRTVPGRGSISLSLLSAPESTGRS